MKTTLKTLREFPGWQDAGQLEDDAGLTDDTAVVVRGDGSVGVDDSDGVLVYGSDASPEWLDWLRERGLLPGAPRE